MTTIALINQSTIADMDVQLGAMAPAMEAYLQDVAAFWGSDCLANVVAVPKGQPIPSGARPIVVADHCNDPGALGYHIDDTGTPSAIIGALDDAADGCVLSVTISHEIAEMQVDPVCSRTVTLADGYTYIVEACDAVEDDSLAYEHLRAPVGFPGVKLSDFVTPAFFGLPNPTGAAVDRYDMCAKLKQPCPAMMPGGYLAREMSGSWTDITARLADRRRSSRANRSGRLAFRARPAPTAG